MEPTKYLSKDQLEDGCYYDGTCRNARQAKWNAKIQKFIHWRQKYGFWYLEEISHPEDEPRYDVFYPFNKTTDLTFGKGEIPD